MDFKKLIENKRVVFVGPATNLLNKNRGREIDKYDIIIKTNGALKLNSIAYYRDYGSRIDVLYVNNQYYRTQKNNLWHLKKYGIKFLRGKSFKYQDRIKFDIPSGSIINAMAEVNKTVKSALMGCYIIQDILMQNPKEFFVTGIDFFNTKNQVFVENDYREYIPGYLPQKIILEGNRINKGKTKDFHDPKSNTEFIYKKWIDKQIILSEFIVKTMLKVLNKND